MQVNNDKEDGMARTARKKTKVCTRCGKRRSLDQFYKEKSSKDGHSPWDKDCERAYNAEYRARKSAEGEKAAPRQRGTKAA
jgi:hypothetical protein